MDSKAQQAIDEIQDRILRGELKPGEFLSEAKLAQELGMTRTPVREALYDLTHRGLIESVGRATRVREPGSDEFREHLLDRFFLEMSVGLALARRRKTEGWEFGELRRILDEMERLKEQTGELRGADCHKRHYIDKFIEKDFAFHRQVAIEARRTNVANYLEKYKNIFLLYSNMKESSIDTDGMMDQVVAEHGRILRSILDADGQEVVRSIRDHICGAAKRWNRRCYDEIVSELSVFEDFGLLSGPTRPPTSGRARARSRSRG